MKRNKNPLVVPAVLALSILGVATPGNAQVIELSQNVPPQPITVSGVSGGSKTSNCGNISAKPNQVVKVTAQRLDYVKVKVEGEGQPTLLVQGPNGRFCVLADTASGEQPEISGVWVEGNYEIFVGDRAGGQHPYTLSILQRPAN